MTGAAGAGAGALCVAAALPLAPGNRAYGELLVLLLIGALGTGLLSTAAALSQRLRPSPRINGAVLALIQVVLFIDAAAGTRPTPPEAGITEPVLILLSLLWPTGCLTTLVLIGRTFVRFVDTPTARRVLRLNAILLTAAVLLGAGLAGQTLTAAPGADTTGLRATELALAATALVLGLLLCLTRAAGRVGQARFGRLAAAVLIWRLGWLEQRLAAAAPAWASPSNLSRPRALTQTTDALYTRILPIWDATRVLLSVTDEAVVAAAAEIAHTYEAASPLSRRAALAEALWIHLALTEPGCLREEERFTPLELGDDRPISDLMAEAKFQRQLGKILRRERKRLHYLGDRALARAAQPAGAESEPSSATAASASRRTP